MNEGTEITSKLLRHDIGIDETQQTKLPLTPLEQLNGSHFEQGSSLSWLAGRKEKRTLTPEQIAYAKLSLQAYKQILEENRTYRQEHGRADTGYGQAAKVVGQVRVSPVGPEGRYMVNFSTTNIQNSEDRRVVASTMLFDVRSQKLDESYPAREDHWVVGDTGDDLEIVGNYKKLHKQSKGKLQERLKGAGYQNIGEVWAADIDRHAGFLPS